jgi:hypothetical protein
MRVNDTCRIIIDNSRVALQSVATLTDNSRAISCGRNVFIMQATGLKSLLVANTLSYLAKTFSDDGNEQFNGLDTRIPP